MQESCLTTLWHACAEYSTRRTERPCSPLRERHPEQPRAHRVASLSHREELIDDLGEAVNLISGVSDQAKTG